MNRRFLAASVFVLGGEVFICTQASADFVKDGKASLDMRNFYLNQDQRQSNAPGKTEEWAQGFILHYTSGYTEGAMGFGVDALGTLGLKLDSSPDRAGTGLLERDNDGRAKDEYGNLGLTAKVHASNSVLKVGVLQPKLPVVQFNDTRLLPQTFQGAWLNVGEFSHLNVDLIRLNKVKQRDSSDYEDMLVNSGVKRNIKVPANTTADYFNMAGGSYKWNNNLSTSYYYGELDRFYRQHYVALQHQLPIAANQTFKTDIRWARSTGTSGSNIDNIMFNTMFSYQLGGHTLGLAYQQMSGETGFATIKGADPYLVNFVQISDFANKDEKSWQARYDYDFAAVGVPGLNVMVRYLVGSGIDTLDGSTHGRERERDIDVGYVVQSGTFKNVGLKWRNAALRSNFSRAIDENRIIASYTLPLSF